MIGHFRELGADIPKDTISRAGWKPTVTIWEAGSYHKIAQSLGIKELKIKNVGDLFFRTENVPEHENKREWSVKLLKDQVRVFREKYGLEYSISNL